MIEHSPFYFTPSISFTPNRIVFYKTFQGESYRSYNKISLANLENNAPDTEISNKAKARIRNSVNWLYAISKDKKINASANHPAYSFRINFITLTLSALQFHDDDFIKKNMLDKLLQWLRKKYKMKAYLWKAESQANGNIHFHITTNVYIPHYDLRNRWNDIQAQYGYLQKFFEKNLHIDPNSTDIHATKGVKNLAGYLATYMTKNPTYRPIQGRQWYQSTSLSKVKNFVIDQPNDNVNNEITKLIKANRTYIKHFDFCSVSYLSWFNLIDPVSYPVLTALRSHIVSLHSDCLN